MDRRNFLVGSAFFSMVFKQSSSYAYKNCALIKDEIQLWVSSSMWIPIGPQGKEITVHAFVASWCPFCKKLMQDATSGIFNFNLKVIICSPGNFIDSITLAELSSGRKVEDEFKYIIRKMKIDQRLNDQRVEVINKIQALTLVVADDWVTQFQPTLRLGFPLWFTSYKDGYWADTGYDKLLMLEKQKNFLPSEIIRLDSSVELSLSNELVTKITPKEMNIINEEARFRILPNQNYFPLLCFGSRGRFKFNGQLSNRYGEWMTSTTKEMILYMHISDLSEI